MQILQQQLIRAQREKILKAVKTSSADEIVVNVGDEEEIDEDDLEEMVRIRRKRGWEIDRRVPKIICYITLLYF